MVQELCGEEEVPGARYAKFGTLSNPIHVCKVNLLLFFIMILYYLSFFGTATRTHLPVKQAGPPGD